MVIKGGLVYMCMFVCDAYIWVCEHVYLAEARWRPSVPLCVSAHLTSWDRVSYWTWSLLLWLGWLASEISGFTCLCTQFWDYWHEQSFLAFYMGTGDSNLVLSILTSILNQWTVSLAIWIEFLKVFGIIGYVNSETHCSDSFKNRLSSWTVG